MFESVFSLVFLRTLKIKLIKSVFLFFNQLLAWNTLISAFKTRITGLFVHINDPVTATIQIWAKIFCVYKIVFFWKFVERVLSSTKFILVVL